MPNPHLDCNEIPDLLRGYDKVRIVKVGVTCRGPVSPMPEQLADQRQVLARHDGLAGGGMSKVIQAKPAGLRIVADSTPTIA